MRRIVQRVLPDGQAYSVQPFHICLRDLEQAILCREEEDYDTMVKAICVCARRKNVIIIIYAVVSNHCHVAVLARCHADADSFAQEIKRIYAQLFQRKYGVKNILRRIEIKAICLDSDQHVRNALAYIPKNAMDNGASVYEYLWTGFRAMFASRQVSENCRQVANLTFRERVAIMHTGDKLDDVPWLLDGEIHLVPSSICDWAYLEQVYNNDPGFFLRLVGGVNSAEMQYELEEKPYQMLSDTEYYKMVEDVCLRWFKAGLSQLSLAQKHRIIPYLFRTTKTTERQLARIVGLPLDRISSILQIAKGPILAG